MHHQVNRKRYDQTDHDPELDGVHRCAGHPSEDRSLGDRKRASRTGETGNLDAGCEIDAGYFEIAQRRIALAQKQPMLPGINEPAPQPEQLSLV